MNFLKVNNRFIMTGIGSHFNPILTDPHTIPQSLSFLNQLLMVFFGYGLFFSKTERWLLNSFFIKCSSLGGSGGPL